MAIPFRDNDRSSRTRRSSPNGPKGPNGYARLRSELADVAIPWVASSNTADERIEARGVLAQEARLARICLFGCGALGSLFAEFLIRGAVRELSLFDKELLELGNLPRHTLGTPDVRRGKADALRRRLSGAYPSSSIRSFQLGLPLRSVQTKAERPAWNAINDADVLIDCTANDTAFRWMSALGRENRKLVVRAFVNVHARMLTLCSSGKHARCTTVAEKLYADIEQEKAGITWDEYDPPERELVQGAGCWHPTFPARGFDIAALAASAVPLLERLIGDGLRFSTGAAFVLRRRDPPAVLESPMSGVPLVEIAWHSRYR
ncbi:ThiF family adenylyltransferase [Sorangium sp. So ce1000]|uniref:ThiF family adenylyltransferase n=1 Tax=Sorangium sp. So ce1000 TaxID=3133325 RepID=UPI003F5FA5E2